MSDRPSRDRVRFYFRQNVGEHDVRAAFDAFNLGSEQVKEAARVNSPIVCRPSQFARFLILVGKYGGNGGPLTYKAELFNPEPPTKQVDVSKAENMYRAEYRS